MIGLPALTCPRPQFLGAIRLFPRCRCHGILGLRPTPAMARSSSFHARFVESGSRKPPSGLMNLIAPTKSRRAAHAFPSVPPPSRPSPSACSVGLAVIELAPWALVIMGKYSLS